MLLESNENPPLKLLSVISDSLKFPVVLPRFS